MKKLKKFKGFFITGTSTEVGKTFVACQLLKFFNQQNYITAGLKPIASGLDNDVGLLQQYATLKLPTTVANPVNFATPIAPHIAAEKAKVKLSVDNLITKLSPAFNNYNADMFIVEGAGGWQVPLNNQETMADFAVALELPVILVVGIQLGCINHTILTVKNMQSYPIKIAGWVANIISPDSLVINENIHDLATRLDIPLLATIKFNLI